MKSIRNFVSRHNRGLFVFGCTLLTLSAMVFITGCGVPSFLTDLETIIPVAGGAITGILAIIGGLTGNVEVVAAANQINAIITKVDAEFQELNKLIASYKSTMDESLLEKIEAAVQGVTSDLATILEIAGLPDGAATAIQGVVQAVLTQLNALLTIIPVFKSSTAGQSLAVIKPVKAEEFKAQIHAALAVKAA